MNSYFFEQLVFAACHHVPLKFLQKFIRPLSHQIGGSVSRRKNTIRRLHVNAAFAGRVEKPGFVIDWIDPDDEQL